MSAPELEVGWHGAAWRDDPAPVPAAARPSTVDHEARQARVLAALTTFWQPRRTLVQRAGMSPNETHRYLQALVAAELAEWSETAPRRPGRGRRQHWYRRR